MATAGQRQVTAAQRVIAELSRHLDADIVVELWNGDILPMKAGARDDVRLVIGSAAAMKRLLLKPSISTIAELFAIGEIDVRGPDLIEAMRRVDPTQFRALPRKVNKATLLKAALPILLHRGKLTESGLEYKTQVASRSDDGRPDTDLIRFHYDVSNAFYALFLDPEMVYSSAYFERPDATLDEAQKAKLDLICRKLRLQPGERFLDIGCGWGALVCHAAQHYGVTAHGATLAQEQYDFAKAKIARLGLEDRVTVELKDYRHLEGTYDKIASIGMFEHVAIDNHDRYFRQMHGLLRPRGLYLHHAIARPAKRDMKRFRRKRPEFAALTQYIFPGGELDAVGMSVTNLERHGFEVHDVEAWREHYQRTTRAWTENLYAAREAAAKEVGEAKTRIWLLYLAGCSLAFERSAVGIFQTLASRKAKGPSGLPPTREDLYRA
jgi:cyclopropane-fatty-acyl-phospholipid synthase